jgi:hypothetical protein
VNSNTPLQALVLLNDVEFAEAARALAAAEFRRSGKRPESAVAALWRRVVSRPATPQELAVLLDLFRQQTARYATAPADAAELLSVGAAPLAKDLPQAELAGVTAVARAVLNLHETITRN